MIEEIDFNNRSNKELDPSVIALAEQSIKAALEEEIRFKTGYQVSVSFVDDQEIRELNSIYRNVDRVTDVLSFPMNDVDGRGVMLLGDIVLCINRAEEQAQEFGHGLDREISYLTVHSVLHLLGFNHETDDEKNDMRAQEKKIMTKLRIFKR